MNKAQALYHFWSSFGLPAYDELSVPDDTKPPYITYETATDSLENALVLSASIWYRQLTWEDVTLKSEEIAKAIVNMYPAGIKIDGGRVYITKGTPFARRAIDESDTMIKRIILNIMAEFFTAS